MAAKPMKGIHAKRRRKTTGESMAAQGEQSISGDPSGSDCAGKGSSDVRQAAKSFGGYRGVGILKSRVWRAEE